MIYISLGSLTSKVSRDWCIDFLIAKKVNVEYWDIYDMIFGNNAASQINDENCPKTFKEFESLLIRPENRGALFVPILSYTGKVARIFYLLSKYNCQIAFFAWGALPATSKSTKWKIIAKLSHPLNLVNSLFDILKARFYKKFKGLKPFDITFAAGQVLMSSDLYTLKKVPVNLCDFDQYISAKRQDKRYVEGEYAVFLDINLAYHPDLALLGEPVVNARNYYCSLNKFFDKIELEHHLKVIIAAHPKSNYSNEVFCGREVYQGITPEIMKDAKFAISHTSTAISYAVLNLKPVVFIYTDEMKEIYKSNVMRTLQDFADYFNVNLYNIDESQSIEVSHVDSLIYDRFKYDFLTSPESENTITEEIFWHEINML